MRGILSPLIIAILAFVIYSSTRTPTLEISTKKQGAADFKFKNVTISMHKEGKKLWTLKASESAIYNHSNTFFLLDIDGQLNQNDGHSLAFKSPTGAYKIKDQSLKLVKTNATLSLLDTTYYIICDEIEINSKSNMVAAYGNLFINSDNMMLKGRKMIANLTTNKLYLTHHVNGTIFTNIFN